MNLFLKIFFELFWFSCDYCLLKFTEDLDFLLLIGAGAEFSSSYGGYLLSYMRLRMAWYTVVVTVLSG